MNAEILRLDDPPIDVRLRVDARARRFTLRLERAGEGAILTLPPGVPMTEARMFLLRQSDWLAGALDRRPEAVPVGEGTQLPVAGRATTVRWERTGRHRAPSLGAGVLTVFGPRAPGPQVAAFLKLRARDALAPAARAYAGQAGARLAGISLRDTSSRWGSCSTTGRLSFSWRLAMSPPEVLDYVAAHEAAHLVEMNHGPRFWSLVEQLAPDYRRHRAWLKAEGPALHRYRFDA